MTYSGTQTLTRTNSDSAAGWHYDGSSFTTVVQLPEAFVRDTTTLEVTFPAAMDDLRLDGMRGYTARLHRGMDLLNSLWEDDWTPETMIDLYQTGRRIELRPQAAERELTTFHDELPRVLDELPALEGNDRTTQRAINHMHSPFDRAGQPLPDVSAPDEASTN